MSLYLGDIPIASDGIHRLTGEIGDIGFAPLGIDESENKRRYLNGQVIIQSQFVAFTNKVKAAIALYPSLATTETNWQAEKTNSKLGQCGKFVVDDTAGTIRLPCVVNVQGLADLALIGGIKSESLPNIRGNIGSINGHGFVADGAFYQTSAYNTNPGGGTGDWRNVAMDASRSSSTYQDNAPVQQEAVQYPYYIVVNTGVEEAERPINNYQVNNVYSYGMSQYYKGVMNNNSWLRSQGQWNDGTVYTGMYNWLLEQMNAGVSGFVASTAAYTDYDFVINTTDQTFRLPLLDGSEDLPDYNKGYGFASSVNGWIAPSNGIVRCIATTNEIIKIFVNDAYIDGNSAPAGTSDVCCWAVVKRGDTVKMIKADNTDAQYQAFYPFTGNGNLYYYVGDTLQNADLINVARIEEKIVDKVNLQQASGAGMPSDRYIDLTLGASGSTYTAPANGWFYLNGICTGAGAYGYLLNSVTGMRYTNQSYTSNTTMAGYLPCKKGDNINCEYGSFTKNIFRFIYAEGEQ